MKTRIEELEEQNRIMFEALDKINNLGFYYVHTGPCIAADVLDAVKPIKEAHVQ